MNTIIPIGSLSYAQRARRVLRARGIWARLVKDEASRKQVKKLWRQGKVSYPLYYKADMAPVRAFYVLASYFNQYRKYSRIERQERAEAKRRGENR